MGGVWSAPPAGITHRTSDAALCDRAGYVHLHRRHQVVRVGLAAPAVLTPFPCDAAPCHRGGCDYLHGCYQCVRRGPAVPAGLTSFIGDTAPCCRAGCGHLRWCHQCERAKGASYTWGALLLLRAMPRFAFVPGVTAYIAASAHTMRVSGISRPYISCERCGAMPSRLT